MPKIVLHHLERSRSTRVLWALEELGLDYELRSYKRDANMRADPSLRDVHALGKSPVLEVDGLALAESGAILEYMVEELGQGRLRPAAGEARQSYRYWMHFAEGTLMPPLLLSLVLGKVEKAPLPFFVKPIARTIVSKVNQSYTHNEIRNNLAFVEDSLAVGPWLCGEELSAADIQMSYPLLAGLGRAPEPERYPRIRSYLDQVQARPAYQRALKVGGAPLPV